MEQALAAAVVFGIVMCLLAGVFAWFLIPQDDEVLPGQRGRLRQRKPAAEGSAWRGMRFAMIGNGPRAADAR